MRHVTIPADASRRLSRLATAGRVQGSCPTPLDCRILASLCSVADWDVDRPARLVTDYLEKLSGWPRQEVRRTSVAALALAFADNAPNFELPSSIRALYPSTFRRLAEELDSGRAYGEEPFAKDVRFVLGLSAPAGAQDIDLAWRKDAIGAVGRAKRAVAGFGRLALAGRYADLPVFLGAGPHHPWLQIHTDSRRLEDFHPEGWDQCYYRVADLLRLHPEYAGMVGQSWFYDPAIKVISPRLAYLQDRPMENGAVRIRLGAGPDDIERATRTSSTRRALHEAGLYQPRCWAIYWPRGALLRWAMASRGSTTRERRAA